MISSIHAYSLEWLCQWKTQQLYRPYRPSGTLSWTPLNSLSLYHQYRCFSFESLRCIVFVADLCFLEELLEAPESAQDQLKDLGDGFVWGNYSTLNQHSTIWLFLNYRKSQEVEIWRPLAWNFWRDGVLFICFGTLLCFVFGDDVLGQPGSFSSCWTTMVAGLLASKSSVKVCWRPGKFERHGFCSSQVDNYWFTGRQR